MKGMNTKLILNESDTESADTLKEKLHRACTEHDVLDAKKDSIIKNGLELFSVDISGMYTFPLGKYPSINDYIKAHSSDTPQDDYSNLTKEQLYSRLVKAAETGKMVEYRRLRKQYSALA